MSGLRPPSLVAGSYTEFVYAGFHYWGRSRSPLIRWDRVELVRPEPRR